MYIADSRTSIFHFALIGIVGLLFTLPAFVTDFVSGHNALTHLLWSKHFAKQLWAGDLYPRWLIDMNAGLGSPAFFFYFPLPYYITSLFHLPLGADSFGWLQLGLSAALALVFSGWSAYLWLSRITDIRSAIIGAIFYMLLPYHLIVDLYYRFAFTEFWAFVWMPLILYFLNGILENSRFAVAGLTISYSLLIMTHLPTTLIFSGIPILYILFLAKRESVAKNIFETIMSLFTGAALSSAYLIPAIFTQKNVSLDKMATGEYHFANNFLFTSLKYQPPESEPYLSFLSITSVSTFIIGIISFFCIYGSSRRFSREGKYWLFISILAIFMMLPLSSSIWEAVPLLQRIQFPCRFNGILTISSTALVTLAISRYTSSFEASRRLAPAILLVFFISQTGLAGLTVVKLATGKWDEKTEGTIARELDLAMEVPEYRPPWSKESLFKTIAEDGMNGRRERVSVDEKSARAIVEEWHPGRIALSADAEEPFTLILGQLYYPGWTATLDGNKDLDIGPSSDKGLVKVMVPRGKHHLVFRLRSGAAERIGQVGSLLGAITFIGLLARSRNQSLSLRDNR